MALLYLFSYVIIAFIALVVGLKLAEKYDPTAPHPVIVFLATGWPLAAVVGVLYLFYWLALKASENLNFSVKIEKSKD